MLFLRLSLAQCGSSLVAWGLSASRGFLLRIPSFSTPLSLHYPSVWPIKPLCLLLSRLLWVSRGVIFISHLPAYFSDVNKRAMLAAPLVCADSLFLESDVTRLLSDTQTSSSLKSQQAMVDVASNTSGPRRRRFSPARSPALSSPSRRRRRDSGSPAC